jgi:glutamate---cysteine ligase / carboxylate-amine ligase
VTIEQHFGEQPEPFTLGVEEEVMILDAETLDQVGAVETLIAEAEGEELPGQLATELFASVVELKTPICRSAAEAAESLETLRRFATAAAARHGLTIAAAGSHPFARPEEQPIAPEDRYAGFVGYAGITARRQGVQGLHVHVGMASPEACFHVLEGMLPWLPVLLALSANSPFLAGEATGLASNRALVLGQLPRSGAPPAFGSYEGWERFAERFQRLGVAGEYTTLWWDVRPHPRFGTLEVRAPDQPTSLRLTAAFVALIQALAATLLDEPPGAATADGRGDYAQNRWAAARFGPEADLVDPRDPERTAKASELGRDLLERVAPAAERLGSTALLEAFDPDRCEAELQLADGDPHAAAAGLVARTAAPSRAR